MTHPHLPLGSPPFSPRFSSQPATLSSLFSFALLLLREDFLSASSFPLCLGEFEILCYYKQRVDSIDYDGGATSMVDQEVNPGPRCKNHKSECTTIDCGGNGVYHFSLISVPWILQSQDFPPCSNHQPGSSVLEALCHVPNKGSMHLQHNLPSPQLTPKYG